MRHISKLILISLLILLGLSLPVASSGIAGTSASAESLAPIQPVDANSRVTAVREGKWPAQVASSRGDIAPDRHGPQRNDPAEGIPTHAYSPFDERVNREYPCPPGGCEFEPGEVLVKLAADQHVRKPRLQAQGALVADSELNQALAAQGVVALQPLFPTAKAPKPGEMILSAQGTLLPRPDLTLWYRGVLASKDADVYETTESLAATAGVEWAEPNYLRKPAGDIRVGATGRSPLPADDHPLAPSSFTDPLYGQQWHLGAVNADQAWAYLDGEGLPPGGDRDIVVAVIDTGVDYTHPDLAANMWVNAAEFSGSPGVDDDGNGFIDDVHGVTVVSNQHSGDPQDDHGHGTHVTGIIAAQADNDIGGVGVAYNVQIMAIKAAQYSGVLSTSDIAEGIYYAVEKGADVINMSFGGYVRSQLEEDALAIAFGQAVLVAAAGNDGIPNLPCKRDMYPAAYNWVLGVMASTSGGDRASFSNYDCTPRDTHEYELLAPGVDVWSTLPGEQYAAWDGTSMAAPVVSGIAALARTKWSDKDVYSSRFIMGQIASNTNPVADAFAALTVAPEPELKYLEHWLFDTGDQSANNDDDGIADAGETVDLAIVIRNHWGKADPVTVTLEAWAEGAVHADPYVTMDIGTVNYGAVGSFNIDDNGLIYDGDGVIIGVSHPFRFSVDPNTPNDHVIPFRLTMTAENGYDPNDPNAPYIFESRFYLIVQRGRELPRIISEDMTLSKEYYWLVSDQTLIETDAIVTVTEGTQIQFWSSSPNDPYYPDPHAYIQVEGELSVIGTYEEPVEFFVSDLWPDEGVTVFNKGVARFYYTKLQDAGRTGTWPFGFGINPSQYSDRSYRIDVIDHSLFSAKNNQDSLINSIVMRNTIVQKIDSSCYVNRSTFEANEFDTMLFDFRRSTCAILIKDNKINNSVIIGKNNDYNEFVVNIAFEQGNQVFNNEQDAIAGTISKYNAILNRYWDPSLSNWTRVSADPGVTHLERDQFAGFVQNYWGTTSETLIDLAIYDYRDDFNLGTIVFDPHLLIPATNTYPFAVSITLSKSGQPEMDALHGPTPTVGAEPVTFTVTFNRDMDISVQPAVSFGPDVPLTDYTIHPIDGGWTNAHTWQGTFNITPVTGDGYQLIRVAGAVAADDPWLVTGDDAGRFRFEIITSGTEAMNLQATGGEGYVDLAWTQDDFELLAGYNLYRSTTEEGAYVRINQGLIPAEQKTFADIDIQPGQPYYYKFTIVKTDMSESDFSNVAQGTPLDTIPPEINHTPVTEAPPQLPLTLTADVTDNVVVQTVTLYYRATGSTDVYQSKAMVKTTGDRYSATIEGNKVTSPGIDYYIKASDGISPVQSGRQEDPHQVVVIDKPVVTAISPDHGPASGGTDVTIAGTNFKVGVTATVGGAACNSLTRVSDSQITCITGSHFPAIVDVTVANLDGQSDSLLRGFTYESDMASLSLPDTGGEQNAIVQIPINAATIEGLVATDLTVVFDPAVLTARTANTGSLTPTWSVVSNTSTPGEIRLAMASSGSTANGEGSLVLIEFEVIGAPGSSSTLSLSSASLNAGAIAVDTADGSFSVADAYEVSGTMRFWKDSAPVPDVQLTLEGDRLYTGLSEADGSYAVSGAPADDYTLTPSKSNDVRGISAFDASQALQHAAELITLSGNAFKAGNVDKDIAITSMDAFYILQKSVDLITLPFPGAGVVWEFDPANRTYTDLNSDQSGQDFTAILLGDISGNWSQTAVAQAEIEEGATVLSLLGGRPDASGIVTATLLFDPQNTSVRSLDLSFDYDPAQLTLLKVTPGSLASECLTQVNASEAGRVNLAVAAALPLTATATMPDDLFLLRFYIHDADAHLNLGRAEINEGLASVTWMSGPVQALSLYMPLMTH